MANDMVENKVVVNIYGEDYPLAGVEDPSQVSKIADFVDSRMKEIAENSRIKARDKVAILSVMSIASELMDKKGETETLEVSIIDQFEVLLTRLDNVLPV
jgi:cell division protein ZapA